MSLSLDLGLFLRNSKTKLGLSLTQRAILFTLAIRIGSNPKTWIKQSTLALELGIVEPNVNRYLQNLKHKKILEIEKQKSDLRKNIYRFSKVLINYHQMNDQEKAKVHEYFNDEMLSHPVDKSKDTCRNRHTSTKDTCRNRHINTCQNRHTSLVIQTPETPVNKGTQEIDHSPKVKGERNNKIYIGRATHIDQSFEYNEKHMDMARVYGLDITWEKDKFIDWAKSKGEIRKDWNASFSNWLRKANEIKEQNKIKFSGNVKRNNENHQTNELRSTVKEWTHGHPDFDRLYGHKKNP